MTSEVPAKYCCDRMRADLEALCSQHENRFDCPDALIHYSARSDRYGLIIHDGGTSSVSISHCPFCGTGLRDLTDHLIAELDENFPDWDWGSLPEKYRTSEWWREKGL